MNGLLKMELHQIGKTYCGKISKNNTYNYQVQTKMGGNPIKGAHN